MTSTRSSTRVAESRFRAMGSDAHLIVVGDHECSAVALHWARERIEQLEERWSRFRVDSEVCELNRRSGTRVEVSRDTRVLVARAVDAWRLTGGGFDPSLLDALTRAGYDRSFERLLESATPAGRPDRARAVVDAASCTDIVVDDRTVALPEGFAFDPGGIGKGLAADLVAAEVIDGGALGVCVNLGGDLRVMGEGPRGAGWTLSIDHPLVEMPIAMVGLWHGAVATSTVLRRRWIVDGSERHHLIDPATSLPSTSDVALATVVCGQAWQAEVLAKASLLRGVDRAFDLLDEHSAGLVVDHAGNVNASEAFSTYLGEQEIPSTISLTTGRARP